MTARRALPVAALFSVLFTGGLLHAEDLTGRILDPDGDAVPNATLRLFDRESGELRSTTSLRDGTYFFQGIESGEYLLEGDAANRALTGSTVVFVTGSQSQDLRLTVSGTSTSVLVTASGSPLSIQEVAKAIDVIDAEELSLRNEFSVAEALRLLPGIRVQTLEGPGSFTRIQTRGLRESDTAVLIDGMRFRDVGSIKGDATSFFEDMLVTDTERIEFLRGSGSSLYGSHALGGVVNVISQSGGGPHRGSVRIEGGGLGLVRGVAGMSGGALSDRLTYSGTASHLYVTKGVRDGIHYRNNSVQGTAKYSFVPAISITGRLWYSNGYLTSTESPTFDPDVLANSSDGQEVRAIPLALDQLALYEKGQPYSVGNATFIPNAIDPDGRRRGAYLSGMLLFQHRLSAETGYRVAYQSVDTRRTTLDGPQGTNFFDTFSPPRSNFDGYIDTLQFRLDQRAGRHNLITFGYEHERENFLNFNGDSAAGVTASRIDLKQHSDAFYVQDQLSLLDGRLQITAAVRAQIFRLRPPEFQGFDNPYTGSVTSIEVPTAYTGDGAVAYFVGSTQTKFRAHVGNSFKAPSGYERFGGGFGSYYGDPRLAPERSVALDAGIDQWFAGARAQVSATWFYTNLQQIIRFVNTFPAGADPFGRVFGGYAGSSGGIARGFEMSGAFSPRTGTRVRASYTFVNSDSRTPTVGQSYHQVLRLSPHTFTATATQWIGTRTNITFDLAAYSDYVNTIFGGGTRLFRFDGPIKPDVMINHRLPYGDDRSIELYGKAENMFGQRPYEDGFVGPGAWFITGIRVNY